MRVTRAVMGRLWRGSQETERRLATSSIATLAEAPIWLVPAPAALAEVAPSARVDRQPFDRPHVLGTIGIGMVASMGTATTLRLGGDTFLLGTASALATRTSAAAGASEPQNRGSRHLSSVTLASACLLAASLSGCDSVNQAVAQAKTSATAVLAPLSSASAGSDSSKALSIAGTELDGVFKRYPLGSPQSRDNYPRAAITIVFATPSILKLGSATVDQCIRFNIWLWLTAKTSRSFDGLRMCANDTSMGVPFRTIQLWQGKYVTWETTGAVRTEGPMRPKTNFPTESVVATAWFSSNLKGIFYVGSILYQLGYDWDQPGEHRLWLVSAPDRRNG